MSPPVTLSIALKALRRNVTRTALTMLGIVIGVAAVIVMVALGRGARDSIEAQVRSAGSNIVVVMAGSGGGGPVRLGQGATTTLKSDDADAIRAEVAGVRYLAPGISMRTQVVAENANWGTQLQGSGAELPELRSWPVEFGRFFEEHEVARAARVAVLGAVVRDELFGPGVDPTGEAIRIRNQPFRILGVLTRKGQAAMGMDQDDTVIVPYTTVQKRLLGITHIQNITISAESDSQLPDIVAQVTALVRARHTIAAGEEDDFAVRTMEEMASMLTATTTTMTWLLAGIATVSLIVGGIGIMNIMLVSVGERTREIGLRLSVGARESDVLLQFLAESIALSGTGGAIGVGIGFVASKLLSSTMQWSASVTSDAVLLAFGSAVVIGVFFGLYPARKASLLNPIDALRYE